jgi:hypothetical protein
MLKAADTAEEAKVGSHSILLKAIPLNIHQTEALATRHGLRSGIELRLPDVTHENLNLTQVPHFQALLRSSGRAMDESTPKFSEAPDKGIQRVF